MGGCLQREEKNTNIHQNILIKNDTIKQIDFTLEELQEYLDLYGQYVINVVFKIKNIIQIIDNRKENKISLIYKEEKSKSQYQIVNLNGNKNQLYIGLRNILIKGENYLLGVIVQNECWIVIYKLLSGLIAQVQIQELQTMNSFNDIKTILINRYKDKYIICGYIEIEDQIILIFRKHYATMNQNPQLNLIHMPYINEGFILQHDHQLYEIL